LKGWNLNIEGEYKKKRGAFAMQLDEIDKKGEMYGLTQSEMERKKLLQNQLKNIVREEEIKWIQRAKEKEILEGDNNTRYYHSKENGRRRRTLIVNLNQDEVYIEGQDNVKRYITDFYKKLFGNPDLNNIRILPEKLGISEARPLWSA
jgi:hypothetical protein